MVSHLDPRHRSGAGRTRKRWAFIRLAWRWAMSYKNFSMRQAWPLRIVLGIVGVVLAAVAVIVVYEMAILAIAIGIGMLLVVAGFGKVFGGGNGDEGYYQTMSDAEQRRHEDEGRV